MVRVDDTQVNVLYSPSEFYQTLVRLASNAKNRVNIATLYIGNSTLELELLRSLKGKPVHILLDGLRGNRKEKSGSSSVEMIREHCPSATVEEFVTPLYRGLYTRLPDRIREIVGTQHMKLFVADDTVVITGANLSEIYFTNRQDRYVVIRDGTLADLLSQVILSQGRVAANTEVSKSQNIGLRVTQSLQRGFEHMNGQSDAVTENLLSGLIDQDVQVTLSSPYLNISPGILAGLLKLSHVNIITNSIETNAFFNSKGPSRFIPDAYAILQGDLMRMVDQNRVKVWEYTRPGWSFHAKGVWVRRGSGEIATSVIGSSNFGYRSMMRDLEISFRLDSENPRIQKQLSTELEQIMAFCKPAAMSQRRHPAWLKFLTRGPLRTFL